MQRIVRILLAGVLAAATAVSVFVAPAYADETGLGGNGRSAAALREDLGMDDVSSAHIEAQAAQWGWDRRYGATRYDTMAAIVRVGFDSSEWVVVASGENFPDALAACALAGAKHCPIVLTEQGRLSEQARDAIEALGATHAYVVGGTAAVSASTLSSLRSLVGDVTRVYGADRMGTSMAAMKELDALGIELGTVIVATGSQFADSLSIAPWSYATCTPILLTAGDGGLTSDELALIEGSESLTQAVIVGGYAAVNASVDDQLDDLNVTRLDGQNRYDTSRRIATWEVSTGVLDWDEPCAATGTNYPDALSGAALGGKRGSVMLLVHEVADADTFLASRGARDYHGAILGGYAALPYRQPNPYNSYPSYASESAQATILGMANAEATPWPGPGLCAAWVSNVYANAGQGTLYGDARDMYAWYTTSSMLEDLKPGMLIAVSSHPHTDLGAIYGHVGIYMGNNVVRHSLSEVVKDMDLYEWLDFYGASVEPRWGFPELA